MRNKKTWLTELWPASAIVGKYSFEVFKRNKIWLLILLAALATENVYAQNCVVKYMETKSGSAINTKEGFIQEYIPSNPPKYYSKETHTYETKVTAAPNYWFYDDSRPNVLCGNYLDEHGSSEETVNRFTRIHTTGNYSGEKTWGGKTLDSNNQLQDDHYLGYIINPVTAEWYWPEGGSDYDSTHYWFVYMLPEPEDIHNDHKHTDLNDYHSPSWGYGSKDDRLETEYKTEDLKSDVEKFLGDSMAAAGWLPVADFDPPPKSISVSSVLNTNHTVASKDKKQIRFRIPLSEKDTHYKFTCPVHVSNGPKEYIVCTAEGNGGEVYATTKTDFACNIPDTAETVTKTIYLDEVKVEPPVKGGGNGGCGSCGGGGGGNGYTAGSGGPAAGGPTFQMSLGYNNSGFPAGDVSFNQSAPASATPAILQLFSTSDEVSYITNNGGLRQVMSSQLLVDIISNTPCQFDMFVYDNTKFSPALVDGLYPVTNGGYFLKWRIENPGGVNDTNNLLMIESRGGHTITNRWTLSGEETIQVFGNGLKTIRQRQFWNENKTSRTEVSQTYNANNVMIYSQTNIYSVDYSGNGRLASSTEGIAGDARTTTYPSSGRVEYPDGSWNQSYYDESGRLTKTESPFHSTTYNYSALGSGDDGSFAQGVARTITDYFYGTVTRKTFRILTFSQRIEILATRPDASWSDSDNLFTTNNYNSDGRLESTISPDHTIRWYSYNIGTAGSTNTISTGYFDGAAYVTNRNETTVFGMNGQILSTTTTENDLLTASSLYTDYDALGRVGRIQYLDGTSDSYQYDCCGVASSVGRNGSVNVNTYNGLKQLASKTEIGVGSVTWYFDYDPLGHLLMTRRLGGASMITNSTATFDTAGHQVTAVNALGGVTSYSEGFLNGYFSRTTTNPDNGTRIETYNAYGTLKSVTGTAAHPVSYDYGPYDGGTWVMETRSSESVKTYTDIAGRTWKTEYPNNAVSTNGYNLLGQLWKQVDPDEVTTIYSYNAKGELAFTTIDPAGVNRITQTITDVVTNDLGTIVRRTQNFVWLNDQSNGTLASVSETSVDGLKSWQVNYGEPNEGKPVKSSSITSISGSNRTTTATAPDGSHTVSTYSFGRLLSSARFDAGNNPLGSTSYTYDEHGRTYQVTDARNGTTTYEYNDADLVNKVTTPVPGGGQPAEVTVTHYNSMLQPDSITQPDGSFVTNVYLLTGEIAQQSGSRTYPVGYGYDYAGRMQFMTNWSSFGSFEGKRVTTWNYSEQRGWLTKKIYPDAVTGDPGTDGPSYEYTPAGRLKTRTWVRGVTTTYNWDATGSMTNIVYSDSTPGVTNVFDRLGRLTTVSSGGTTETLTYNLANELLSESFAGGILDGLTVTNSFDAYLRRSSLSAMAGSQPLATANFTYTSDSRLSTVSDGNGNSATYSYLANSPLVSQIAFKQGTTTQMTTTKQSDFLNRLKQISSVPATNGALPLSFHYNYNSANQRTKSTLADGSFWSYEYDSLGQVTNGVKHFADGTLVPGQSFGYLFDDIGNRKQTQSGGDQSGAGLRPANYTVNSLNQITSREFPGTNDIIGAALIGNSVSVNGNTNVFRKGEYFSAVVGTNNTDSPVWLGVTVASGGKTNTGNIYFPKTPEQFIYDADGNLVSDGLWTNTWNAENRLIVSESSASVPPDARMKEEWSYLPDGRWSQRIVSKWISDAYVAQFTNKFVWDGKVLTAIADQTNGLVMSFLRGTDLSGTMQGAGGAGGLLAVSFKTNGTHFAAFDGNGNVAGLVSAADGSTSANYEYGPFGEAVRITGPVGKLNPIRFSTQFADDVRNITKYLYREYIPSTGTWPNHDPLNEIGFQALNPSRRSFDRSHEKNLYNYVNNDPEGKFDVLGLSAADVKAITDAFWKLFDEMCKSKKCCPEMGWRQNMPWSSTMGCKKQADNVQNMLQNLLSPNKTDDFWLWDVAYKPVFKGNDPGSHNYSVLGSVNPDDPIITLDTWHGCLITYTRDSTIAGDKGTTDDWKQWTSDPPGLDHSHYNMHKDCRRCDGKTNPPDPELPPIRPPPWGLH